ncbi:MAG: helix-turn-helix domain-containing protein [Oscillospiraceae bacterium]|nr:helix-turn-helix domain-containing protein [Oscillospiraceae bacterium]
MFNSYPDIVTVNQLQKMLGVGRNTAYKLLSEQKIQSKKIGRIYIIPKNSIIKFLSGN